MEIQFKGNAIQTEGSFPNVGEQLPEMRFVRKDLNELNTQELKGQKLVFNIFPSVDTGVCAMQLKQFSQKLSDRNDVTLVFASKDLPFALKRFCGDEGIENAITTSDFRYGDAAKLGAVMKDGPLAGLLARGVIVTDERLNILHSELVNEVTDEPDYDAALKHV